MPIAWSWVRYVRGHSPAKQQISLLQSVKKEQNQQGMPL
jgi:hypothetical protein